MTPPRPDAPLRLRDAARLAGTTPGALKHRLRAHERATGTALLLRHGARGRLYTTIALCRAAFGDGFGVPDLADRIDLLERRERGLRADVNALARRMKVFVSTLSDLVQRADITKERSYGAATEGRIESRQIASDRGRAATDKLRGA